MEDRLLGEVDDVDDRGATRQGQHGFDQAYRIGGGGDEEDNIQMGEAVPAGQTEEGMSESASLIRQHADSYEHMCRICFEQEEDEDDPLIAPCKCKGASKYVHRSCLDKWRSTSRDSAWSRCDVCLHPYTILRKQPEHLSSIDTAGAYARFVALVTRDFVFLFLIVQLLIGVVTAALMLIDNGRKHGTRHVVFGIFEKDCSQFLEHESPELFERGYWCAHPLQAYYIASVCLLFSVLVLAYIPEAAKALNSFCSRGFFGALMEAIEFFPLFVALVVLLILVGVIFALVGVLVCVQSIVQKHMQKIHKRSLASEFYVADLDKLAAEGDTQAAAGGAAGAEDEGCIVCDSMRGRTMTSGDREYLSGINLI